MRIAVNTRLLLKDRLEGIGWFTYETLKRITRQHPEHQFFFIFDRKYDDSFIFSDNITPLVTGPQARHPVLFYLWFEHSIPRLLNKLNADLFLSTDGYLSLSTNKKSFVVMHDLNFEHYPEYVPFMARKHYRHYFPKYARKADRIATVSEFSKLDIVEQYRVSPDKIDVVYNGANEKFRPLTESEITGVRKKYTKGLPYFIFIGALHPRKNLVNLFKAYDRFCDVCSEKVKLMIVGEKLYWTREIREAYETMKYKDEVLFSGRLGFEELQNIMGAALALAYVSRFEGFGIPIVEAFYAGIPVITSNITSMPEVAGDAALLADPFSIESISNAMEQMATDVKLRKSLIEKGNERKKLFTWQKSADRLWESIEKII